MFVLFAVGVGAAIGLVIGRVLAWRETQPPEEIVIHEEPAHLTTEQLDALLAPYEHYEHAA
jgi:hypothetical protein